MIKRWLFSLSLLVGLLVMPLGSATAASFNPFGGVNCSGAGRNSAVCKSQSPNQNPLTGPNGYLTKATNIVAFIAGIGAVILAVVSGIRFMLAAGNSEKITAARKTLTGALIGVAVVVLARTIIVFVIDRL